MEPFDKLIAGIERAPRGGRHRPPADDRVVDPRRARAARSPSASSTARGEDVAQRIWRKDESLWGGPGVPEIGNRLGWLTISRPDARARRRARTRSRDEVRADGLHRRGAARHGRLERSAPRCSGAASARSPGGLRLHVLDSTDPGAVLARRARGRPRQDAVHRLVEVRRDDRDALALRATSTSATGGDGAPASSPSPTRAARSRSSPTSTASGACSRTTRTSAGATRVLSYFGLVPAALMGVDVEALLDRARWPSRTAQLRLARARTPACGSGCVLGELALAGPRQAHVRRRRADRELRPVGRAADRRVDRQAGQGHPARSPTSRSATPDAYGDDRVFVYLRDADEPDAAAATRRSRRSAQPATRR